LGQRPGPLEDLGVTGPGVTKGFWAGRRVFLTGHTGFKGAWMAAWLTRMGAEVTGYALAPETDPNLWSLLRLSPVRSVIGDLNDRAALDRALAEARPEVVLHLAAQALVRRSYRDPVATFASNVMGTVQLLDAVRACAELRAIVVATSDKAYENVEQIWGYRETDPMGGRDPYSASKGACEIAARSMAASFFADGGHPAGVATVRAGNVIGGGDWSEDRLIPDIVRGCLGPEGTVTLRAPGSVRPWQHVLEPLRGYLMVAERLHAGDATAIGGWNFGPERRDERAVGEVAGAVVAALGRGRILIDPAGATLHEAKMLRLDCTKARLGLGWVPRLGFDECIGLTADWYGGWAAGRDPATLTLDQIAAYEERTDR
jgi:CDP-glucose 4,6-dehydratase